MADVTSSELSASSSALPGDTLGRYRLIQKIARGGMAEVFAARSFGAHGFEKTVAIKRILPKYGDDPQFVRMMVDEAKITVLLNHPNVATILELAEQEGDYFIVMEFVPGLSLASLVKKLRERNEKMGVLEACFVVVETLQGLHAAHVQRDSSGRPANIIHRDVSPQNVLVSFDGHVKVIDFGIARATRRLELTEIGTIKGKLRYLAPEMIDPARFMADGDFDHRVDVFAAGIVLWELIANRTLYAGDDEMIVYDAITDSDAPNLAAMGACDAALAKIAAKALTRDPEKRYLSAEDFADDLRAYVYRTDAAFTHKRITAVMERCFPVEKEEMLALERGGGGPNSGPTRAAPAKDATTNQPPPASLHSSGSVQVASVFTSHPPPSNKDALAKIAKAEKEAIAKEAEALAQAQAKEKHATGEQKKSARVSHNDSGAVKPIEPDARTRTQHVSGMASPAEPTVAMRSDANKKIERRSKEPEKGDVLTVMTLVSRVSGERKKSNAAQADDFDQPGPGPLTKAEALAQEFQAQQSTVTIPKEKIGDDFRDAVDRATASSSTAALDETPYTQERSRKPVQSRSMSRRQRQQRSRALGLFAASVAGIAVIAIAAIVLSRPPAKDDSDTPASSKTAYSSKDAVHVNVSSTAPNATVVLPSGESQSLPATIGALPGDSLEIIVRAPGYREKRPRVSIPSRGAHDVPLEVQLDALPGTLKLVVKPADAVVTIAGDDGVERPYQAGMLVDPGKPLTINASAPGYVSLKREIAVNAGETVEQSIELERVDAAPVDTPPSVPTKRVEKKAPASTAMAKLKVMSNLWANVTIDGKKFEDQTPMSADLKPGKHTVTVEHPPQKKTQSITLKPGESTSIKVTFD